MDHKVQKLVESLITVNQIVEQDTNNCTVVRLSNTIVAKMTVVACASKEPIHVVLPLNTLWVCLDPSSIHYGKIMARVNKNKESPDAIFAHTWEEVSTWPQITRIQWYDATDLAYLQRSSTIGDATDLVKGIVRLSQPPEDEANPIAVGDNDPRLTDDRFPKPHDSMHQKYPAEQLNTLNGFVDISVTADPLPGQVLMAISPTEVAWVTLTASDIH